MPETTAKSSAAAASAPRIDDLAHVADVEEPGGRAHRLVFGHVARVAHGHVPAGELGEGGAQRDVLIVQGGASS